MLDLLLAFSETYFFYNKNKFRAKLEISGTELSSFLPKSGVSILAVYHLSLATYHQTCTLLLEFVAMRNICFYFERTKRIGQGVKH